MAHAFNQNTRKAHILSENLSLSDGVCLKA
jgi:hypothetical protein